MAGTTPGRVGTNRRLDVVYQQVREILASARDRAWQAINTAMVDAYHIGHVTARRVMDELG